MLFHIFEENLHSLKLVIDIGNTYTKIALFESKKVVRVSVVDSLDLKIAKKFISSELITSSIISSVKEISPAVESVVSFYNSLVLSHKTRVPITNNYVTTKTLGNDRLAAIVGASLLFPKNDVLIFDAGTCLTIDFLDANKNYHGGRISPGIEMRFLALHTFTSKLPLLQQENIYSYIGNDTESSIISGVQEGIMSEIKSIISEYKSKNSNIIIVFTGGDCFFFEKELKNSIFANPNLVLIGLNEILDYNE